MKRLLLIIAGLTGAAMGMEPTSPTPQDHAPLRRRLTFPSPEFQENITSAELSEPLGSDDFLLGKSLDETRSILKKSTQQPPKTKSYKLDRTFWKRYNALANELKLNILLFAYHPHSIRSITENHDPAIARARTAQGKEILVTASTDGQIEGFSIAPNRRKRLFSFTDPSLAYMRGLNPIITRDQSGVSIEGFEGQKKLLTKMPSGLIWGSNQSSPCKTKFSGTTVEDLILDVPGEWLREIASKGGNVTTKTIKLSQKKIAQKQKRKQQTN